MGAFMETNVLIKKLFFYFGLAFIFMFCVFLSNQFILLILGISEVRPSFLEYLSFLPILLPTVFIMGIPFAVCIGFVQFLILNENKIASIKNKTICIILCFGISFSFVSYIISDFILPQANLKYSNMYSEYVSTDRFDNLEIAENNPRNMNSFTLKRNIDEIMNERIVGYERNLNQFKLEFHKKYSLPVGSFVFSLFALLVSFLLKNRRYIGLIISIFSCFIYWVLMVYSEIFSLNYGKYEIIAVWFPNIFYLFLTFILFIIYKKKTVRIRADG